MKEFKIGNTTLRIHSPLMEKTREERKEWLREELKKGNPVLKEIETAVINCYRD